MKHTVVSLLCLLLASVAMGQEPSAMGEYKNLRLLYAGHPGSARETDFVKFLEQYFETVETGDLATFKESDADGYDVVFFDYDGDGFEAPRPRMSEHYDQATMAIGVVGSLMCNNMRLKTGYL